MSDTSDDAARMTGAHALDALTPAERQEVEAALAASAEMRAEADSLRETALALAFAVPPVEPSADLKASVMSLIASTPQLPAPATAATAAEPGLEARPAPVTDVASAGGRAASNARRRWFQRPGAVLSAAAAVVVVFLGVGIGVNTIDHQPGGGSSQVQAASGLDKIYAASDFQRATTRVSGGGTATVVWSDQLGKSAVILDGVQAAPKGKTYELWYIGSEASGGKINSAGLVNGVDGGVRSAVLSGTKASGDTVGMTVEPAGGSKQPTTTPIVAVPTAQS